jgi:hypothetical protein
MPTSVSENPAAPHSSATPTINAKGHLVTGSGFLPDHTVALRITRAGEDIDDYLAYVTDGDGYLHSELPSSVAERDRRHPALARPGSVHSPDPALAAATKLGIKWPNLQSGAGPALSRGPSQRWLLLQVSRRSGAGAMQSQRCHLRFPGRN